MHYRLGLLVWCGVVGCGPTDRVAAGDGGETEGAPASSDEGETGSEEGIATTDGDASSSSGGIAPADPFAGARYVVLEHAWAGYTVGDYDRDGDDDLLISYEHEPPLFPTESLPRLSIFAWSADAEAFENTFYQNVGIVMSNLVAGHVDAGSTLDVVGGNSLQQAAWIDDAFEFGPAGAAESVLGSPRDIDGDGRIEFLEAAGDTIRTYGADGAGGWALEQVIASDTGCSPRWAAWGDVDGDGRLDLAALGVCDEQGVVDLFLQNDDGTFTAGSRLASDRLGDTLCIADLDRDRELDIVVSEFSEDGAAPANIAAWGGVGNGTFADSPLVLDLPPIEFGIVPTALDVDDDGVDEAMMHYVPPSLDDEAGAAILRVEDSSFVATDRVPFDVMPFLKGDVDGDGCGDLVGQPLGVSGVGVIIRACE